MGLTPRQAEILAYIIEYSDIRGYAPTLHEIGEKFGLSSVATVHKHISNLVDKGYLRHERRNASRDLEVIRLGGGQRGTVRIPLLGTVAAGQPGDDAGMKPDLHPRWTVRLFPLQRIE